MDQHNPYAEPAVEVVAKPAIALDVRQHEISGQAVLATVTVSRRKLG